jgi:hypothetical protein
MQFEGRGKDTTDHGISGPIPQSIATIEASLTALVDRMVGEVEVRGTVTETSAAELRQIRLEAERLLRISSGAVKTLLT